MKGESIRIHYINRSDRDDRNYLLRGAMAAMGWRPEELVRIIAKHREDYPSRKEVCDAACADGFEGFFNRMRYWNKERPGYGSLVSSWSYMRSWRMIAEGNEPVIHLLDDYYIKQPKPALEFLLAPLDDFNIVQLAWHERDDIFFLDWYDLKIPYNHVAEKVSAKSPYFLEGAWQGCSDWALVLSPQGAAWMLDYMETESVINADCVTTAMQHSGRNYTGIYSLRDQPRDVNGNDVLRTNPWVGHLIEYTDAPVSNLMGTHTILDMTPDGELGWDKRLEERSSDES